MASSMFLLLLLSSSVGSELVTGHLSSGSCVCPFNASAWAFPTLRYEAVQQAVESCEHAVETQKNQVMLSSQRLPQMRALMQNLTSRLEPYLYLDKIGLHKLWLRSLGQELQKLEEDIGVLHSQRASAATRNLSQEAIKLRKDVEKMHRFDNLNMMGIKDKLRYLKNRAVSCRSIPQDFRATFPGCSRGLISSISSPVVTKISPFGKSLTSGSWGKQTQQDSPEHRNAYWVQPLANSHAYGITLRLYPSYENLMASTGHSDLNFAPSYSDKSANEGPNAVLRGDALYYHCYNSADVCRYNISGNSVARARLPGVGVGFHNKFPYCYYDCSGFSDVDLEADESGVWAIYATLGSHGNLVVSRLEWDGAALNVTHKWETRVFKKAVSNSFIACGVLYATRYVDAGREEVFYAFDTATGMHDSSLAIPLEKVSKGVASLSYNPIDRQIYMYNDGYLLAHQAVF